MTPRSGFLSSLRGRLIAVLILGLGATAFAVVALTHLARTSREQRTAHAHERVEGELERLAEAVPVLPRPQRLKHGRRGVGELRSGYVDAAAAIQSPRLASLFHEVEVTGQTVIEQSTSTEGVPVVAGAAKVEGGFVWAVQRVVVGPEMSSLRVAVFSLAIAMFAMVFASVQTLVVFDRGAGALREAVVALGRDLHARVPRPKLRELAEVADGLDALARDLSRAEAEKERLGHELAEHERLATLGRVVAGVAHEVRNPLAAIKLRTDLAETSTDVPSALREDLALIGSEVARLDRLVRDLLLLADKKPLSRERVDLAHLVAARVELLRPWAGGHRVHFEVAGNAHALIDPDSVTRAIDNLLRNGVEASPADGVVRVAVSETAGTASVVVSDQGGGVPPSGVALLFEPFFTTKPAGTGLGLALSRAVAVAHDGSLEHARRDGLTQFTLQLGTG